MTLRNTVAGFLATLLVSCSSPAPEATLKAQELGVIPNGIHIDARKFAPLTVAALHDMGKDFVADSDHYFFEAASYEKTNVTVRIVYHKSFKDLLAASGYKGMTPGELRAFTYPDKDGTGVCEIHIMDPKVVYYPQYVGHELLHCTHGDFHPSQG
jgi:hypothetical protein